jgi:PAS domain S-box-containing protein
MRPDESFRNIFGVSDNDDQDTHLEVFAKRIHKDDQPRVRQAIAHVLQAGGNYDEEYRILRPDGSERWIAARGRVEKDTTGVAVRFPGVVIDITERKHADELLRFQLDLTKSITDNATTAIFMLDSNSQCTFLNPAAKEMTGFCLQELQGQPLHHFIHHHREDGSVYPTEECPLDRALNDRADVREHHDVFIRKNGEYFQFLAARR